jgi:predicted PurR-regulated permease PerM
MLAVLLNPLTNWLERKKFNRTVAIAIAIVISLLFLALVTYFLSTQIASLSDQLPTFKNKFLELFHNIQLGIAERFNIDVPKQNRWMSDAENGLKPVLGQTISVAAATVEILLLVPLYAFLFLYYKKLLLNFLYEIFAEENAKEVSVVLTQTKAAIQQYMVGLLIETITVAILNSVALMILGIKYAILLGSIGALLNILPFIGGVIAILLPLIIATVTKDGFGSQIGIVIAYVTIQFIDNHFLVPYIVSSKVKINALTSIIIVLLGGLVWGIAGMFLSIPFIGILKIIFDRTPDLKPWGKLFGDEVPTRHKGEIWKLKR